MGSDANRDQVRKQIRAQRREEATDGAAVIGYEDAAGVDRSVQGDEEAPFLKTPPFPTRVTRWLRVENLQSAASWVFTSALDVASARLLTVWFEYDSDADDQSLLVVPQARRDPDQSFYTITVIDPLITRVVGTAPFPATETFGQRDMMATQLRIPPTPAGGVAIFSRQVVQFDVAAYSAFRLGLSTGADDGALTLDYNFAE